MNRKAARYTAQINIHVCDFSALPPIRRTKFTPRPPGGNSCQIYLIPIFFDISNDFIIYTHI